ncbi:MAG TPA: RidA family protein [Candidatus Manganitrophaceae bacterium]|nr:RidA family protein [Candidatus Manganitrophaceae bacterium]
MDYEKKLQSLGLALPPPPKPVATYVPCVRSGNLLFLSGMIPMVDGKMAKVGKLGKELAIEEGQEMARITLLNALAVIKAECGSLDQIERIVRIGLHVASAEGFTQQSAVANGASDLLVQIFGEPGRHARLALGAAELPLNAPVELEMIAQVR